MGLFPGDNELERAPCTDSLLFRMIMTCDATTTGHQTNMDTGAGGAADPNTWEATLKFLAYDVEHTKNSSKGILNVAEIIDSPTIRTDRNELRFMIQLDVKLVVETTQREDMRDLAGNTICDVFTIGTVLPWTALRNLTSC